MACIEHCRCKALLLGLLGSASVEDTTVALHNLSTFLYSSESAAGVALGMGLFKAREQAL